MKFFISVIAAAIIFYPIDKKHKLCLKYHNHLNKRFRFFIFITGTLSCVIELLIAFLSEEYLKSIGVNRDLLSLIFVVPLIFILMVAAMPIGDE
ncbi:MAG: hypothetical protein LIR50_08310 [Bacillota bacterium]|nr:hypothetical protein [Bacillota bacterium]